MQRYEILKYKKATAKTVANSKYRVVFLPYKRLHEVN